MESMYGQTEAAISAQLAAVRSEKSSGGGSLYDKMVQVLLFVTVVLLPLFYLPWTSSIVEYNKQMLLVGAAAVALVLWLLRAVISGKLTVRTSPLDKGVLGLLLASVAATVFSMTPAGSLFGAGTSLSSSLLSVLGLTVVYFLIVNTMHDRGRLLRTALMFSLGIALVSGFCQMFSWNFLPGAFTNSRAFTTVGSFNTLGILAAIGLALFAKTAYRGSNRLGALLSYLGVAIALGILVILNWWTLWAVALGGMLAMIALDSLNVTQLSEDYGGRRNRFAMSRFIIPMTVVVLGAVLLLVRFDLKSVKSDFPIEVGPSQSLSWHVAVAALKEKPIVGFGPENFSFAFDKFGAGTLAQSQFLNIRFFDGASEFVTLVVQQGVIGFLAVLFLLWCILQIIARFGGVISESIARGEGAALATQSTGTLSALVAVTVALFLYPMNLTLWFVFYVLLALGALIISGDSSRTVDIEKRPLYSLSASLGFIVALILVLSGLYLTSVRYVADVRYAHALTHDTPAKVMDGIAHAVSLNANNDQYLRDASQVALKLLGQEIAKKDASGDQAQRIQNLMASCIQLAQRAAAIQPHESLNWTNLGVVYQSMTGLVDNVEKLAEDAFTKAGELRPGDPSYDNAIGQMWLTRADLIKQASQRSTGSALESLKKQQKESLVKAEDAFKRALVISSTYGLAIYNLGAVYDRQNKVPEAIAQLEKIAPYNSNQPTLMFELGLLYIRNDQKERATAAMSRAVLLSPQYANARWYLALLLESNGDIEGALKQLREIQKGNNENATLQAKIDALEAGQSSASPEDIIDTKPL